MELNKYFVVGCAWVAWAIVVIACALSGNGDLASEVGVIGVIALAIVTYKVLGRG